MRSPRTTTKSSPRLAHLEKARAQQRRPNAAKNKLKKEKKVLFIECLLYTGHFKFNISNPYNSPASKFYFLYFLHEKIENQGG